MTPKSLIASILVLALGLFAPTTGWAAIATIDNVPSTTLLMPYFEVSLDDPNGIDTVLNINNASATAVLAHVTLLTDLARPSYTFTVYLSGYDSATVDMRLVFDGILPVSASAGQDPSDQISPRGSIAQDINFASCTGALPPARLTDAERNHLRLAHTGQASPTWGGNCGAVARGDNHARGFVTIDTVNSCSALFPNDPSYLSTVITRQNVLFGEYEFIERTSSLAYGDALVGVEGSFTDAQVTTSGRYTFYGRFNGYTATDGREPLATSWRARYTTGPVNPTTDIIVWRDPGATDTAAPFPCGAIPAPYPLGQADANVFDESEHVTDLSGNLFPYAANRVTVSSSSLGALPYSSGILNLNLNTGTPGGPASSSGTRQSYVVVLQRIPNRFSAAWSAFPMDNALYPSNFVIIP